MGMLVIRIGSCGTVAGEIVGFVCGIGEVKTK
jgi:hypothetical protein